MPPRKSPRNRIAVGALAAFLIVIGGAREAGSIDLNGNGMSDVWEETYSVAPETAGEDFNGNGLTNLKESKLGLDPRQLNSHFTVSVALEVDQLRLSFETQIGKIYQLDKGFDLQNWDPFDDPIIGTGNLIEITTLRPTDSRVFFRGRLTGDVDTDGDGLSAWEEAQLGTNDNSADSDADGLPDVWEFQFDLDPGVI